MDIKNKNIDQARILLAKVGSIMYKKGLTDLAGGNISLRVEDKVVMSPSLAGTYKFWEIKPEDVLVLDLDGNKLEGNGKISREAVTHLMMLNRFYPFGKAVIHAHPKNVLVFCATNQPIPPVLECTQKYGEIRVVEYAHGGIQNKQLAENIYSGLEDQKERIKEYAAAVIAPWHGIFSVGRDLESVLDTIDRIETNARCILMGMRLMENKDRLDKPSQKLNEAIKKSRGQSGE